jgi:uracil phosphoribosyltransferase
MQAKDGQARNGQAGVTTVDHPLVQHKLTIMRDKQTASPEFRRLLREISLLLGYEVTRRLELKQVDVETPVSRTSSPVLSRPEPCLITILRAGNGLLDGMLDLIPAAPVGHVGLYRDPQTLEAIEYYYKVPRDMSQRLTIVVDPMLATGHTAVAALDLLKRDGARDISFVCLVAAPEGIAELRRAHPDVPIFAAAVDEKLNEKGYIVPGLGDAGDRIFGTK